MFERSIDALCDLLPTMSKKGARARVNLRLLYAATSVDHGVSWTRQRNVAQRTTALQRIADVLVAGCGTLEYLSCHMTHYTAELFIASGLFSRPAYKLETLVLHLHPPYLGDPPVPHGPSTRHVLTFQLFSGWLRGADPGWFPGAEPGWLGGAAPCISHLELTNIDLLPEIISSSSNSSVIYLQLEASSPATWHMIPAIFPNAQELVLQEGELARSSPFHWPTSPFSGHSLVRIALCVFHQSTAGLVTAALRTSQFAEVNFVYNGTEAIALDEILTGAGTVGPVAASLTAPGFFLDAVFGTLYLSLTITTPHRAYGVRFQVPTAGRWATRLRALNQVTSHLVHLDLSTRVYAAVFDVVVTFPVLRVLIIRMVRQGCFDHGAATAQPLWTPLPPDPDVQWQGPRPKHSYVPRRYTEYGEGFRIPLTEGKIRCPHLMCLHIFGNAQYNGQPSRLRGLSLASFCYDLGFWTTKRPSCDPSLPHLILSNVLVTGRGGGHWHAGLPAMFRAIDESNEPR